MRACSGMWMGPGPQRGKASHDVEMAPWRPGEGAGPRCGGGGAGAWNWSSITMTTTFCRHRDLLKLASRLSPTARYPFCSCTFLAVTKLFSTVLLRPGALDHDLAYPSLPPCARPFTSARSRPTPTTQPPASDPRALVIRQHHEAAEATAEAAALGHGEGRRTIRTVLQGFRVRLSCPPEPRRRQHQPLCAITCLHTRRVAAAGRRGHTAGQEGQQAHLYEHRVQVMPL